MDIEAIKEKFGESTLIAPTKEELDKLRGSFKGYLALSIWVLPGVLCSLIATTALIFMPAYLTGSIITLIITLALFSLYFIAMMLWTLFKDGESTLNGGLYVIALALSLGIFSGILDFFDDVAIDWAVLIYTLLIILLGIVLCIRERGVTLSAYFGRVLTIFKPLRLLLSPALAFIAAPVAYPIYRLCGKRRAEKLVEEFELYKGAGAEIAKMLRQSKVVGELTEFFAPVAIKELSAIQRSSDIRVKEDRVSFMLRITSYSAHLSVESFDFVKANIAPIKSGVELYGLSLALADSLANELSPSAAYIAGGAPHELSASVSAGLIEMVLIISNQSYEAPRSIYEMSEGGTAKE